MLFQTLSCIRIPRICVAIPFLFFLFTGKSAEAQETVNIKVRRSYYRYKQRNFYYTDAPNVSIASSYTFFKHDSASAKTMTLHYFRSHFPKASIDSSRKNSYALKRISFNSIPYVDSVVLDMHWNVARDRVAIRFSSVSTFKKGVKKSLENYLSSVSKKKGKALLDSLSGYLCRQLDALDSSNIYRYEDLTFLHAYTLHSRWERFPPDSLSEERERVLRDSIGIEAYRVKEDLSLDSAAVPNLKKWILSSLRKEERVYCTYNPHHVYRFYDVHGTQVGHLEICFQCGQYKLHLAPLSYYQEGTFTEEEAAQFKMQLQKSGIRNLE